MLLLQFLLRCICLAKTGLFCFFLQLKLEVMVGVSLPDINCHRIYFVDGGILVSQGSHIEDPCENESKAFKPTPHNFKCS